MGLGFDDADQDVLFEVGGFWFAERISGAVVKGQPRSVPAVPDATATACTPSTCTDPTL